MDLKIKGKIEYKRDQYLPSPEVCDWLLSLEWSEPIPVILTSYPEGGPHDVSESRKIDFICAHAALGADHVIDIELPAESLWFLKEDAKARAAVELVESY